MNTLTSKIYRFLDTLYAPYEAVNEGLTCEIRTLDGPTPLEKKQHWFGVKEQFLQKAADYCARHRTDTNLYMGVLPRQGRSDRANDCPYTAWLWCDIDAGEDEPEAPMTLLSKACASLPLPRIVVCSGVYQTDAGKCSGLHCYWPLETVEPLHDSASRARFKGVLKRLALAIGGEVPLAHADSSGADIARILRVARTYNHKRESPAPVIPHYVQTAAMSLDWWDLMLPNPVPPSEERRVLKARDGRIVSNWEAKALAESNWAMQGYAEGTRHKRLASDGKGLANDKGLSEDEGRQVIEIKAARSVGAHPISREEIDGIIKWAWQGRA